MSAVAYDPEEEERQRATAALALNPNQPIALPQQQPGLALSPEQPGGPSPTDALALDQDKVDAVSGPTGGGPPSAPGAVPGGQLSTDQLMKSALTEYPGMTEPGNIDLTNRPHVKNADGSTSTVRSLGVNIDGQEVLIPTVSEDGRIMSDDEAVEQYKKTGRHLGKFDSVDASNNAAERIHEQQASLIEQPAAGRPKPFNALDEQQKTLEQQDALQVQAIEAKQKEQRAQTALNTINQQQADEQARLATEAAQRQQQITEHANSMTQAWMDRASQETDRFMKMGLHDYWDDKSTGDKVLAKLSVLVGAVGRTDNSTNPGLQMLNQDIERDFRKQQANIAKQGHNVELAKGQVESGLTYKQQQLADNNLKKAAAYEAAAAQGVALKLKQGVPLQEAQNDSGIIALRQEGAKTRMETLKAIHDQNLKDAQAQSLLNYNNERLKIEKERADAYAAGQAAKAKKGHGGGGGGAGGKVDQAVVTLRQEMQTAVDSGKPMSGDQVTARAVQLGIPIEAKAGHASLAKLQKTIAGEGGLQARTERQESKDAEAWSKENGVQAVVKKQTELSSVLDEIKNAPHNPLQQALAVEKAVSSARGGAASKQALELALKHLGGRWDSIQAMVQGAKNGELGQAQMDNFIGFMTNQLGTAQKEGKDKYDDFDKYIASQPAQKRAGLEAQRGRLFSGLSGFGAKAAGGKAAAPGGGGTLPGGMKIVKVRDTQTGDVIEAIKRPDGSLVDRRTGKLLE